MKFPSLPLGAIFFLSVLAVHAATSDDMLIYSDRFNNGWGDGWSWMTHYPTNNPVYTSNPVFVASNSMALVPSVPYVVWLLKNATTTVDATLYTNLSFWINGGATGGQNISVSGELNGSSSGLPSVSVTAPTNWLMFAGDNNEKLIPVVNGGAGNSWVGGWLDRTTASDNTNTINHASDSNALIAPYLALNH